MSNKYFTPTNSKIYTINFATFSRIENLVKWINHSRYKSLDKKKYPAKAVIVDFSKCKPTIKPYHITPLACIVHEYQMKGYAVKLKNIPENINETLRHLTFSNFVAMVLLLIFQKVMIVKFYHFG